MRSSIFDVPERLFENVLAIGISLMKSDERHALRRWRNSSGGLCPDGHSKTSLSFA
jgi:hypothetical protein